jgi:hypothetical protein
MAGDGDLGPVARAVEADLERLSPEVRDGGMAALARALARNVDEDRAPSACARELRGVLIDLLGQPGEVEPPLRGKGAAVADLSSRIAARRDSSSG